MKTKYLLSIVMLLLLVFAQVVSAGKTKPDLSEILEKAHKAEKVPVIILFQERPTPADISIIKSDGASIKYQYDIINAVAAKVPIQAADKIAKRPFVKLVEPDYKVKLVLDNSIPQIQADKVWEIGVTGKGIDVAVIDTGIHDEHPSLTVETEIDYTGEGTDDLNGHGTHVAGIIASTDSTYRGVAYDADLFNVKVLNRFGSGFGSDVIKGIEWAVDNGAEVISMSLGAEIETCDGTDAISQAVDKAVSRGIVVVVAVGNSGPDSGTITSPGCSKKGIAIGAVDSEDNVPSFSSRGPTDDGRVKPDLVAPGVTITSTWNDNSFKSLSGTSMSTPHVSGVAALLLEIDPSLNPSGILEVLKLTALDLGLDENTQGAGRVDAYEAYIVVSNITEEPIEDNKTEEKREENKTREDKKIGGRGKEFGLSKKRGIGPGNPFYFVDKLSERLSLIFTFNKVKKAEKYLEFAEERLAEAIEEDAAKTIDDLLEEYQGSIDKANEISSIARQLGEDVTKVSELVAIATSIHFDVLDDLYSRVPEQAKASVKEARDFSKKGNIEAISILKDIKPQRAAELNIDYAGKNLLRAQEKARNGKSNEVEGLVVDYGERIKEAEKISQIANNVDAENIDKLVAEASSKHLDILADIYEKVPEQAKPAVTKAITVSVEGRERAVEALKKKDALGTIPEQIPIPKEIKGKIPAIAKGKIPTIIPKEKPEEEEIEVEIPEKPSVTTTPSTATKGQATGSEVGSEAGTSAGGVASSESSDSGDGSGSGSGGSSGSSGGSSSGSSGGKGSGKNSGGRP